VALHEQPHPRRVREADAHLPPTLEVVAARAGVSRATASRVLRGATNVSDEARESVLEAAREIAYTPNRAARALVTRRSESVAFLIAESEDRVFTDPFFLGMLRGAQGEIADAGLQMVLVIASSAAEVRQFEHYARGGHVDGVLLLSLHGNADLPRNLAAMGMPIVLSGRPFGGADPTRFADGPAIDIPYVDADNFGGARLATRFLLDRGARRIGTITGPLDMTAAQDRLAGYRTALVEAAVRPLPALIAHADYTIEDGERAMRGLLGTDSTIDAVFAASDRLAIGAIRAIVASGRRVPDDIAVVGFDDSREGQVAVPSLTTVHQSLDMMGAAMARMLLDRIDGRQPEHFRILPVEMVRRDSA
jgi:DNA-binding LacI/PurR family transcriptional regulator